MPHHDLVIIGSGSGNSLLIPELDGLDVAIVEGGTFGGTCLNVGCIPTKMFVLPADRVLEAHEAHRLGVTFAEPTVDWPGIRDRIFGRIDPISAGGEAYRRGQEHTTLYRAHATFTGERRLALATGEEVTADRLVVAAGSHAVGLDVDGLRAPDPAHGVHTSDTVMRLDALPPRMAVIGGGFVACEMAHVFASLGVAVTQVQRGEALLRHHEVEVSQRYTEIARHRYDVRLSTTPTSAERIGDVWRIGLTGPGWREPRRGRGRAARRRPRPQHRPARPRRGRPRGARRRAARRRRPAARHGTGRLGPRRRLVGPPAQARRQPRGPDRRAQPRRRPRPARRRHHARTDARPVPHAVFGHPQVAAFGPTAAELDAAGTAFVTATQAVGDVAYGWALEDTTGLLTVHADPAGSDPRRARHRAARLDASSSRSCRPRRSGSARSTSPAASTGSTRPSPRSSRTPCSACRSPDPA